MRVHSQRHIDILRQVKPDLRLEEESLGVGLLAEVQRRAYVGRDESSPSSSISCTECI